MRICAVGGCRNTALTRNGISMHAFPLKDPKRLKLWSKFIRLRKPKWPGPTKYSCVCSAHFLNSDFKSDLKYRLGYCKHNILNKDATPTIQSTVQTVSSETKTTADVGLELTHQ